MKMYDMHIHARGVEPNPEHLLSRLSEVGLYGACVLSNSSLREDPVRGTDFEARMKELEGWSKGYEDRIFPVLRMHPYEDSIIEKVRIAAERGVKAFKLLCTDYYIYEDKPMQVLAEIASLGKPVIFHTGIIWDGAVSSNYNRPLNWEALLDIDNITFSMGHCSWPWHDECIALYGKFLNAKHKGKNVDMFFDLTPGTPEIYREDLLTKLLRVGYYVPDNIMFGTDGTAHNYNVGWTKRWLDIDNAIYDKLGAGPKLRSKIYGENLLRFLGISDKKVEMHTLTPDNQEMWTPEKEG